MENENTPKVGYFNLTPHKCFSGDVVDNVNEPVRIKFPCVICQNGDPYSNIICPECQEDIDLNEELSDDIEAFIARQNKIYGSLSCELGNEIRRHTQAIFKQLWDIKIEWVEINGRKELKKNIYSEYGGSLCAFIDGKVRNVADHLNEIENRPR